MSGYIGNILVPQATQTRDSFIATAGQTSFPTSGYTPNFLDVYLNGIKLHSSDFTATNGSDVVLTTGAAVNDVIEVVAYNAFDVASGTFDDLTVNNNIAVSGTVDGRDIATDGTKLDGIESGATGDQTNAEIRAAVEAATDSNVFTDADHTKLNAIEASATADQTAAEIRTLVESATDSNVFTDADHTKLNAIEANATADQTKSDIDALNINADTLDGQHGSYYTGYADTAVANIVDSAPGTLDTLNELAAALGDDPNFATTVTNSIATKLPLAGGTMTGALITTGLTVDTNTLHVDATNNRVGIGTSSPTHTLHVNNSIRASSSLVSIDPTGSASAPSLIFNGDDDTGLYRPASNILAISTAGTERMRIDSSGRVGIGTASYSGVNNKLSIQGTGGSSGSSTNTAADEVFIDNNGDTGITLGSSNTGLGTYAFADSDVALRGAIQYDHSDDSMNFRVSSANRMRIDSSGNVGIGTSSPSTKLEVAGDVKLGAVNPMQTATNVVHGTSGQNGFSIRTAVSGATTPTYSNIDDPNTGVFFPVADTLGITTGGTERMRINSLGNVGIGTSSPLTALHIENLGVGSANFNKGIIIKTGNGSFTSGHGPMLEFRNEDVYMAGIRGIRESGWASGLQFFTHNSSSGNVYGTTFLERMRINASGDILAKTIDARIGSDVGAIEYGTSTANSVRFYSNNSERMRIDSSGNAIFTKSGGAYLQLKDASAVRGAINVNTSDGLIFTTGSSFTERMRIDSSGNVGIGTSSELAKLSVASSADATIKLTKLGTQAITGNAGAKIEFNHAESASDGADGNTTSAIIQARPISGWGGVLTFATNPADGNNTTAPTERMRIDSSGNVLVGTTDTTPYNNSANSTADNGIALGSSGILSVAKHSDSPIIANRTGSDGGVIKLHKSGVDRGGIGLNNGDPYIARASGSGMRWYNGAVVPTNEVGNDSNNTMDLGSNSVRFKHGYFSGSLYGDGSNLTGVGGSTAYNGVGTYVYGIHDASGNTLTHNTTFAGSTVTALAAFTGATATSSLGRATITSGALSGTWRSMGGGHDTRASHHRIATLFVRIS